MSDAIRDMVAFLIQSPGWKPDRFAIQREKTCTKCRKKKHLEKFKYGGSICKTCATLLTQQWRKNRPKHA